MDNLEAETLVSGKAECLLAIGNVDKKCKFLKGPSPIKHRPTLQIKLHTIPLSAQLLSLNLL